MAEALVGGGVLTGALVVAGMHLESLVAEVEPQMALLVEQALVPYPREQQVSGASLLDSVAAGAVPPRAATSAPRFAGFNAEPVAGCCAASEPLQGCLC